MASHKTTPKYPPLQVVLSPDDYEEVIDLAKSESRSKSKMGAILIKEALIARTGAGKDDKQPTV